MVVPLFTEVLFGVPGDRYTAVAGGINVEIISIISVIDTARPIILFFNPLFTTILYASTLLFLGICQIP